MFHKISDKLLQTIKKQNICLSSIHRVSVKLNNLDIHYFRKIRETRYTMNCDGSFTPRQDIHDDPRSIGITHEDDNNGANLLANDIKFLKEFGARIERY